MMKSFEFSVKFSALDKLDQFPERLQVFILLTFRGTNLKICLRIAAIYRNIQYYLQKKLAYFIRHSIKGKLNHIWKYDVSLFSKPDIQIKIRLSE